MVGWEYEDVGASSSKKSRIRRNIKISQDPRESSTDIVCFLGFVPEPRVS